MKSERITFAISLDNKNEIKRLSKKYGLSVSAFVRAMSLGISGSNQKPIMLNKLRKPLKTTVEYKNGKISDYVAVVKELKIVLQKRKIEIES